MDQARERRIEAEVPPSPVVRETDDLLFANCREMIGVKTVFARHAGIFNEGEEARLFYRVLAGAVRTQRSLGDGRRHVEAFHLPGELFGLESSAMHRLEAEAVINTTVLSFKRSSVEALAGRNIDVAQHLWRLTTGRLERSIEHRLMLGRMTAAERVAAFLVDMQERMRPTGDIELPMTRRDIADYLGLTLETVSRVMTELHAKGMVERSGARHIRVQRRSSLKALSSGL
jgi:CRP-like cAMP-binding protein